VSPAHVGTVRTLNVFQRTGGGASIIERSGQQKQITPRVEAVSKSAPKGRNINPGKAFPLQRKRMRITLAGQNRGGNTGRHADHRKTFCREGSKPLPGEEHRTGAQEGPEAPSLSKSTKGGGLGGREIGRWVVARPGKNPSRASVRGGCENKDKKQAATFGHLEAKACRHGGKTQYGVTNHGVP